jgi:hypothetical protein
MSDPIYENIGDPITCMIEECSELIHILCKVKRFGWKNWHPSDPSQYPNYLKVFDEIEDVEKRIARLKIEVEKQASV